jgi:DNA-binding SARP family transcriptional activator/WD40 repeat protein
MGIAVLGPLELDGAESALGLRDRVVLQALAVRHGRPVSADTLAEALWADDPPNSWVKVVQGCVVRLRKALGADTIETSTQGYRLQVHRDHLDHLRFEHLLERARQLTAGGEPDRAAYLLREALELWRGEPFAELAEWAPGREETERLVELRHDAEDLLIEAQLLAGHHREAIAPALRLVHEEPMRERRWGLLALAQYQGGRQGDALQTLQQARRVLVDELGLDPGDDLVALERAILNQDPSLAVEAAIPGPTSECPYLGLVAYDVEDASAFFGREEVTAACLRRLDQADVLAVVGPSGSGKSSLARAGVAAALERDGRVVHVLTPGSRPMRALSGVPTRPGTVLLVDQCEEALAVDEASPERAEFFAALVEFAHRHPLVVTLRADRLGELAPHPAFARLVEGGLYLLGPMTEPDLRRAIEGPAAQAGLRLEPGLVDLLVREVVGEPSALPLLSHVLRQTWRHREGSTLTVEGYAATGGVREAVAQSAEGVFRALDPERQAMLRELMLRLVTPDEGGDPVRTRVPRRSVTGDEQHLKLVEQLVGARLLASDGDTVEIAHESLAVAWPRLRSWLDEDVDGLRTLRHLTVAAESWDELGRPDSELYRGVRQARAAEWHQRTSATLTETERDFLHESAALAAKEQRATEAQVRRERRSNQRLRAGLAAVAVLLAVSIVAGALAKTAADRAEHQALSADARRLGAEALRSDEIDRALLLAAAGAQLDPSSDTVNNLTGVLDRVPQLAGTVRSGTPLVSVSVSPDGTSVATGGAIRGVSILDAKTLKEKARNDDIPVAGVRYNPAGSTLAVAVNPWTPFSLGRVDPMPLRLLDAQTGRLVPHQPGGTPPGRVVHQSFAFSPDGRWLAAGFVSPLGFPADSVVQVWDTTALARPKTSFTVPYIIASIQVSSGSRRIHAMSLTGDLHLLDPLARHELRAIHTVKASSNHLGPVAVVATPDGSGVVVRDGKQVRLLDAERLTTTASLTEEGAIGLPIAVAPDGRHLAYVVDGTVVVRSLTEADSQAVRYPSADTSEPWGLAFGRDGTTLFAARDDGLLLAWDLTGSQGFLPFTPPLTGTLAAGYSSSRVSPDGLTVAYLVTSTDNGSVFLQLLDVRTHTLGPALRTDETLDYWIDVAWSPDSTKVAAMLGTERLRVWDRLTGKLVEEHRVPGEHITAAAFSRDGSRLAIGTRSGWVRSVDGAGRRTGPPVRVSSSVPVTAVSLDGRGDRAVATAGDTVEILDLVAGTVTRRAALGYTLNAAVWIPDGSAVAVTGQDFRRGGAGVVGVFDAATLTRTGGATGRTTAGGGRLLLDSAGTQLLTTFGDRVALWDAETGALVRSLRVGDRMAGGFDPGGRTLVLASTQASVSHWDPSPEAAIEAACQVVGRDMTAEEWHTYLPDRPFEPVCAS